jgi:hypothetical protein
MLPPEQVRRSFHAIKAANALREVVRGKVMALHLAAPGIDHAANAREYFGCFEKVHAAYVADYGG